jgi:hypothetical protein
MQAASFFLYICSSVIYRSSALSFRVGFRVLLECIAISYFLGLQDICIRAFPAVSITGCFCFSCLTRMKTPFGECGRRSRLALYASSESRVETGKVAVLGDVK